MVGLAGQSTHPLGAHVQQVRRLLGRIGDPAAHAAAAVDQQRSNPAAGELRGEDGSRRATPDNRDRR